MHETHILQDVLIILSAAILVVSLVRLLKASSVLGYLAAGMLIGPAGLALVNRSENIAFLAEFGVLFLLFAIGLELSFERLKAIRKYVFGFGSLQVFLTTAVLSGIAFLCGINMVSAIIIGGALALSSTAFVLQLLQERNEQVTRPGRVAFSTLLLQDLAVVPLLALLPILAHNGTHLAQAVGQALGSGIVAVAGMLLIGRLILRPAYRAVATTRSSELFVATTLLVVLGGSWIMGELGLSMSLGAFLCGLMLSGTEYRHQIDSDIHPFRGILMGLFFMTVGMSLDMGVLEQNWVQIFAIVGTLLVVKASIIIGLALVYGLRLGGAVRLGLLLAQGGEFAFVLFGSAAQLGLLDVALVQKLNAAVIITMLLTPILAGFGSLFQAMVERRDRVIAPDIRQEMANQAQHVIIAGFGRVGQTVARVLSAAQIPYLALDLDLNRVTQCRARGMNVFYGDASRLQLLQDAGASRARGVVVTIDQPHAASRVLAELRQNFANLPVVVRARDLNHAAQLKAGGATAVVPDTVEASLQLGGILMNEMGQAQSDIIQLMNSFRRDDYAALETVVLGRAR